MAALSLLLVDCCVLCGVRWLLFIWWWRVSFAVVLRVVCFLLVGAVVGSLLVVGCWLCVVLVFVVDCWLVVARCL